LVYRQTPWRPGKTTQGEQMKQCNLIIFDCDGVLVDSEPLSAAVVCEMVSEFGLQMEVDDVLERFNGRKVTDWVAEIETALNRPIAETFIPEFRRRAAEKFRTSLMPVPGIKALLEELEKPYCLASSGPLSKIQLTLSLTGLLHFFDGKIFSGYEVGVWKPDPGLFLHAAAALKTPPQQCVVIEDSHAGIQAGLSAGMTVFHYNPKAESSPCNHEGVLTFTSMDQVPALLGL
jgi:HAD superfamily hydrolase (TIGR01509 family)